MFTLDKRGDLGCRGGEEGYHGGLSCESGLNMLERVRAVSSFRGKNLCSTEERSVSELHKIVLLFGTALLAE